MAQALKKILSGEFLSVDLNLHIAMDSTLVKSEVKQSCVTSDSNDHITIPPTYIVSTPRYLLYYMIIIHKQAVIDFSYNNVHIQIRFKMETSVVGDTAEVRSV